MLTCDEALWPEKLAHFDAIEGVVVSDNTAKTDDQYDGLYLRNVVSVELLAEIHHKAVGETNQKMKAHIYHNPDSSRDIQIESGDWL